MSDRQEIAGDRTERPTQDAEVVLTVADVLAMPAVLQGAPRVVVGGAALHAPVRWVHVSDSAGVARLLDGGELLLTTGAGWPVEAVQLARFAQGLSAAGVAGIVFELSEERPSVPDAVTETCAAAGLALVVLSREVKFVAVTESVHRALIDAQTAALGERRRLHELFTDLSLRGAPADVIVAETARAVGAPVILANLAHDVIAVESLRTPVAEALAAWGRGDADDRVPVQARGVRWGTLSALPGPAPAAGRLTALEQGATALAFGCLADGGADEWSVLAQQGLIDDLLGARFAGVDDIAARLESGGLPLADRRCHGLVLRDADPAADIVARAAAAGSAARAGRARSHDVILLSLPASAVLSDAMLRSITGARATVYVGSAAVGVLELLASVRGALDLAENDRGGAGAQVRRVDDRPLERLVASLRDDHRLHEHSERMLAPLIRYDRERRGDLLAVLTALVAHPGSRSAAAAASHLSRSVFYQRLALIGDLLGADLDDGETLAALHLALLARGRARTA